MPSYPETVSDAIAVSETVTTQYAAGSTVSDTIVMAESTALTWLAGEILADLLSFRESTSVVGVYRLSVSDVVALSEKLARALLVSATDSIVMADVATAARALFVADALGMADVTSLTGVYLLSLADTIVANDALANFWGKSATDNVAFVETISPLWQFVRAVSDALLFFDTFTPTFQIRVTMADTLDISDLATLTGIYKQSVSDAFEFSCAFLSPSGSFTTWAINTRTSAITEYQNYAFNSFAQLGHRFLGAASSGLYVLDGVLDNTSSIVARVKSGSAQFSGSRYTAFNAVYLGCRVSDGAKDWFLKLHTGDGLEYVYQFNPLNRRTTKIFVGRGLRARYFSWELITAGENFDLDSIEFVPIGTKRRV